MPLPPGPTLPRTVQTLAWITRPGPWMKRLRDSYGDVFTVRVAHEGTWVFLSNPEHIKEVFTGDPSLLHAGEGNVILRPFLGHRSVLLLDDEPHMTQRKLLLPPFHGERMTRYGEVMREVAEREIGTWGSGEVLSVAPRMQAVTLEIIMRTVFGIEEDTRLRALRALLAEMSNWTTQPRRMLRLALLGPDRAERLGAFRRALEPVDAALYEEIRRAREDPAIAEREDILSLLVQARHEDGSAMTDRELRDQLVTLLVAGHETTATTLAWAVERLSRVPGGWEQVRESDEYTEAVVRETLRLRPVIPLVARRLTAPATIAGHDLPRGVTVNPCVYLVHRRPDIYPDPEVFRPERFLDKGPGTYTWIPFGGGIRRCLGASFALFEMQVVLRALAERALTPARPAPEHTVRRAITLTPSRGGEVLVG